ncbi:MAG TPA: hypothetical protein VHG91_01690 [Longimicrobium sp.]|nr:hypothetical protein [Longimicrobium sp.]
MKRTWVCLGVLLLVGAQSVDAQQCRRYRNGRVTVCEREDRDRARERERVRETRVRHERRARGGNDIEFGVRGGYDFGEETGMAGAQLRLPLAGPVALSPSADVFFDEAATEWQLNGDLLLRPRSLAGLYGGAGVAFVNGDLDSDGDDGTEVGYNLVVGLDAGGRIGDTSIRPFVEGRWTDVDEYDAFRLVAGINVPVGRRGW